ncbi:MAG: hypothetical protein ABFD90_05520 [Phycisphaerales bacterium]
MRRLSKQSAELDLYQARILRDAADQLKPLADLLIGDDKTLLLMYIQAGCSFQQLARLTGMNRSSVGRRIRRIIRRLSDPTYTLCLDDRRGFSNLERAVIRDHFIRGLSLTHICRDHGLCYYRARVIVARARQATRSQATK